MRSYVCVSMCPIKKWRRGIRDFLLEFIITGRANSEPSKDKVFMLSKIFHWKLLSVFLSYHICVVVNVKVHKNTWRNNREKHNFLADQSSVLLFELFMSESKEKRRRKNIKVLHPLVLAVVCIFKVIINCNQPQTFLYL